jgi:hypothetical protein
MAVQGSEVNGRLIDRSDGRMPWDGVIRERDSGPLIEHVRQLGRRRDYSSRSRVKNVDALHNN